MFTPQQMLERVGTTATLKAQDCDCFDAEVDHIQVAPYGWLVSMHGVLGPPSAVTNPRVTLEALVAASGSVRCCLRRRGVKSSTRGHSKSMRLHAHGQIPRPSV
jgi:hypothetical protein